MKLRTVCIAAHWESVTVLPSWPNSVVGIGDGDLEARSVAMVGGVAVYRGRATWWCIATGVLGVSVWC